MMIASITESWNRIIEVVDLRLVLWGGLSIAAISGTAVLLQRFAKGRLVTKCVVWSIVAHLVLGSLLHDPNKRLPQGNSRDPRDQGPASIRVTLAPASAPSEPTQSPPLSSESPKPWDLVESPPDLVAATPPRELLDAAERAAQVAPLESPPIEVPKIDPVVRQTPWKPAAPKQLAASRAVRAPAAAQGIFAPIDPSADTPSTLAPTASRPDRLDLDEHVADTKAPATAETPSPSMESLPPNLLAEAPSQPLLSKSLGPSERATAPDQKVLLDEQGAVASIMSLVKKPAQPLANGEAMPDILSLRVASNRSEVARQFGATEESERAIDLALAWLARNQSPDGRWDADRYGAGRETKVLEKDRQGAGAKADTAMTGLALLAFLGNGQTQFDGEYSENVKRGLEYLKRVQGRDGNLYGEAEYFAQMYSHGMATIAIGEAMAMTGDESLKPVLQKAMIFTLKMQHPRFGGWRYTSPQQKADDLGDMSQFGWQVMALKSASLSGLHSPERSRAGMLKFMSSVSTGKSAGLAKYYPIPGERASRTMTAEAACCRFFLGVDETPGQRAELTEFLLEQLPGEGNVDFYYWYYGTLALFQRQGEPWKAWNTALQEQLLDRQSGSGEFAGSWDPDKVWGSHGGRIYSTALATLCLEVYYRYLPVYQSAQNDVVRPGNLAR